VAGIDRRSRNCSSRSGGIILHPEMLEVSKLMDDLKKQILLLCQNDGGLADFNDQGEQTTKYADDLPQLLQKWKSLGAQATKFRSVFKISESTPS